MGKEKRERRMGKAESALWCPSGHVHRPHTLRTLQPCYCRLLVWNGLERQEKHAWSRAALIMTAEAGKEMPLLPALSPGPPGLTSHVSDRDWNHCLRTSSGWVRPEKQLVISQRQCWAGSCLGRESRPWLMTCLCQREKEKEQDHPLSLPLDPQRQGNERSSREPWAMNHGSTL